MQYLFCKDAVYALQAEKLKSVLRADPSVYQAPALVQIQKGWLAIAKLKPLSLFISLF